LIDIHEEEDNLTPQTSERACKKLLVIPENQMFCERKYLLFTLKQGALAKLRAASHER